MHIEPSSLACSAVKEEKRPRIKGWRKATFFSRNTNLMMFFILFHSLVSYGAGRRPWVCSDNGELLHCLPTLLSPDGSTWMFPGGTLGVGRPLCNCLSAVQKWGKSDSACLLARCYCPVERKKKLHNCLASSPTFELLLFKAELVLLRVKWSHTSLFVKKQNKTWSKASQEK